MVVALRNNRPGWVAWYKTPSWNRLRKWQLRQDPMCCFCRKEGRSSLANTVDHIIPHKGDKTLFFQRENLQSLCKVCHSSTKALLEHGKVTGCNEKGLIPAWQENPEGKEATAQLSSQQLCRMHLKEKSHLIM